MEDAEEIVEAGADRAIATEFEAVVGMFDDILRHYRVAPEIILEHEETLRRGSYEAFDTDMMGDAGLWSASWTTIASPRAPSRSARAPPSPAARSQTSSSTSA